MFNEVWLLLAGLALLVGFASRQTALTLTGTLLLAVIGVAWAWDRWALRGVTYRRRLSERRAFLGETLELELSAGNGKLLPLGWLVVQDEIPNAVTVLDAELAPASQPTVSYLTSFLSLRWFERVRWRVHLRCDTRGFFYLGPAHVATGDLFGLFRQSQDLPVQDILIVYPRLYNLEAAGLPAKDPFGAARTRQRLFEDPSRTVGIRDYDAADPLKRVHWKATAQKQALQVRVYEPTTHPQLLVCLNVTTLAHDWEGSNPELLERAISLAGSLAGFGVERRFEVGLLANGCWPLSDQPLKVLPGRSPYQLLHILEALAAIGAMPTARLDDLLLRESGRLPWGATLAVVTGVMTEELCVALLRLRDAGRQVALFYLGAEPLAQELPGVVVYGVSEEDGVMRVEELS
jgi:uncharacterized protein (DUF58 family)